MLKASDVNCREYMKEWRSKNRDKIRGYMKKYFKNNPWMYHLELSRGRCKNNPYYNGENGRKVLNTLTRDQIKFIWFRDVAWNLKKPSINRINTEGCYSLDNCEFIELAVNQSIANIGRKWPNRICKPWSQERRNKHKITMKEVYRKKSIRDKGELLICREGKDGLD